MRTKGKDDTKSETLLVLFTMVLFTIKIKEPPREPSENILLKKLHSTKKPKGLLNLKTHEWVDHLNQNELC